MAVLGAALLLVLLDQLLERLAQRVAFAVAALGEDPQPGQEAVQQRGLLVAVGGQLLHGAGLLERAGPRA